MKEKMRHQDNMLMIVTSELILHAKFNNVKNISCYKLKLKLKKYEMFHTWWRLLPPLVSNNINHLQ